MGDPLNDRLPPLPRALPVSPVIAWIGGTAVVHGERDASEMCLCGFPEYFACPDWIAGNGTVSSLIFTATSDSFYVNSPERCWTEDDAADSCTDDADWTWPR